MTILIAGQIASGKSTVAEVLSSILDLPVFGFGKYVAHLAQLLNLDPDDRETKQDLGFVLSKRTTRFCAGFLAWTHREGNMIVDGLRHLDMFTNIQRLLPNERILLVYVDTPDSIAENRFVEREKHATAIADVRKHVVESEIDQLKSIADFVISDTNMETIERLAKEISG